MYDMRVPTREASLWFLIALMTPLVVFLDLTWTTVLHSLTIFLTAVFSYNTGHSDGAIEEMDKHIAFLEELSAEMRHDERAPSWE